jgi:hypothetical protein
MAKTKLTTADFERHLKEQMEFLAGSAAAYDTGMLGEAKRIATVIRVLVHDTAKSVSLLTHLGVKDTLAFMDTAVPIDPRNMLTTPGLVMLQVTSTERTFEPPLDRLIPPRQNPPKPFTQWWTDPVTKSQDGTFSRRDYILTLANKEGGAHVDHQLDDAWVKLTREHSLELDWFAPGTDPPEDWTPTQGDPALACVRQIAYEVDQTLTNQLVRFMK